MWPALLIVAASSFASALPKWSELQQPLDGGGVVAPDNGRESSAEVIKRLISADIIPTLIPPFTPYLNLTAHWPSASSLLGNPLSPSLLTSEPLITTLDFTPPQLGKARTQFILALTDPDAPSSSNRSWSQVAHWITYYPANFTDHPPEYAPRNDSGLPIEQGRDTKIDVLPYKPPGPPEGTGRHRYVLLGFLPLNATRERLNLTVPSGRRRWGHEEPGMGVAEWAEENGLWPVGANFIYSEYEE
ncbi:putative phosphatidylethanolamine-binding protein 2 [Elsinoe fawcettii]|nr:putative phosphatidylethanolamine-binding protein 2 [Elsinoe fawcettii]